jgi:hypothetical protein
MKISHIQIRKVLTGGSYWQIIPFVPRELSVPLRKQKYSGALGIEGFGASEKLFLPELATPITSGNEMVLVTPQERGFRVPLPHGKAGRVGRLL